MKDKLTYKLENIILENEYTEVKIKSKIDDREVHMKNAVIKFRYKPKEDKGYLNFGECNGSKLCEIEDNNINEVILNKDCLIIETNEKTYVLNKDRDKLYF